MSFCIIFHNYKGLFIKFPFPAKKKRNIGRLWVEFRPILSLGRATSRITLSFPFFAASCWALSFGLVGFRRETTDDRDRAHGSDMMVRTTSSHMETLMGPPEVPFQQPFSACGDVGSGGRLRL